MFRADAVIVLIVGGDRGPGTLRPGILKLRHQATSLQMLVGREAAEFEQRGIDVEQLHGLVTTAVRSDPGSGEEQGHSGRTIPEGVLAGDLLFT